MGRIYFLFGVVYKLFFAIVVGSKNHAKLSAYFTDHEKIENQFPRTKNIDSRNTEKNKSLFTIHANQKCPFTLHEKSIEDPLKFGKNRPDSCRISETFFSYVSLNLSEYFGIRCVRIPVLMFRVFISAGDQVAIA